MTVTLEELAAQEHTVDFIRFGHADAWEVGASIVARAQREPLALTAAVFLGEQRVFHVGMPGTSADNDDWMQRKVAVVRRYDAASLHVTLRFRSFGVDEVSPRFGLDPRTHTLSGGAVPIRIAGTQVGVVVVSGLDEFEDHAIAFDALRAYSARP